MNDTREHSSRGPSKFKQRFICTASELQEKNFGIEENNQEATTGKILHEILSKSDAKEIEKLMKEHEKTLTDFDREALQRAFNFQEQLIAENKGKVLREHKVDLSFIAPEIGFGTLDFAIVEPYKKAVLKDYKFFQQKGLDPAEENDQIKLYSIGLAREFELESVRGIVYMPHFDGVSEVTWSASRLQYMASAYRLKNKTISDNPYTFKMGDHCKHCTAKAFCPPQIENALSLDPKAVINFPGPKIADFLDRGEPAIKWLGALKQFAYARLSAGGMIPGYDLVNGKKSRDWNILDPKQLEKALVKIGKMHTKKKFRIKDFWTVPEIKSPAQVESLVGKSEPIKKELDQLIETKAGALVLAKVMEKKGTDHAEGQQEAVQRENPSIEGGSDGR